MDLHAGQLRVTPRAVRALVAAQFPAWRHLPLELVDQEGTTSALWRIGDELVARFALVGADPAVHRRALEREAAAAAELAGRLRVASPTPVAIGEPGPGYPLPWSVSTWVVGTPMSRAAPDAGGSLALADDLAELLVALRAIPTLGRRHEGAGRGGRLADHEGWVRTCLQRSRALPDVDADAVGRLWRQLGALPPPGRQTMTHGDLIPGNVLLDAGRLAGVVDVGGFGAADPALDLVCAWHLLEAEPRARLRARLGEDDATWARGAGWALQQAVGLGWYYADSLPALSRLGRRTLRRLLEDARGLR